MKRFVLMCFAVLSTACVPAMMRDENYWALTADALIAMNKAYASKDLPAFSAYVAPETVFNRDDFMTAVENDFSGFVTVEYDAKIRDLKHFRAQGDNNETVVATVEFSRSAFTYRYGTTLSMGETVLTFDVTPDKVFLLKNMEDPPLYGLIAP